MSRKPVAVLMVVILVIVALLIAGASAFFWVKGRKVRQAFDQAEQSFARGAWSSARRNYGYYLSKNPNDIDALAKYVESCQNTLANRPRMLRDVCSAYYQMAVNTPANEDILRKLMELYKSLRSWDNMIYYADHFQKRQPEHGWLDYYRAFALSNLQRHQEAVEACRALVESGTEHADIYGILARLLNEQGLHGQALEILESAVADRPGDALILLQYMGHFLNTGDIGRAKEILDEATVLAPDNPEVLRAGLRLAVAEERWQDASVLGARALTVEPDNAETCALLIRTYQSQRNVAKAFLLLEDMDPFLRADNPELILFHHELLLSDGQPGEAAAVVDEFRTTYPKRLMLAEYMEALILLAEGQHESATEKLVTVVKGLPSFRQGHYYLAQAYLRLNQPDRARGTLEVFLRNHPNDEQAKGLFERVFVSGKTYQDIQAVAQATLAQAEAPVETLTSVAQSLFAGVREERFPEDEAQVARQLLERAVEQRPAAYPAYSVLAELLTWLGEAEEAEAVLDSASTAGATVQQIAQARAGIALAGDDTAEALRIFDERAADAEMTVEAITRWAGLFAARTDLSATLALLSRAGQLVSPEERQLLEIEEIAMCARFGDLDQALSLLTAVESRSPESVDLKKALSRQKGVLANLLSRSGESERLGEAQRLLDEILRDEPGNVDFLLARARVLFRFKPPQNAASRSILERLLEESPDDAEVLTMLADVASREGNLVQALAYARHAAVSAPLDSRAQLALASIQMRRSEFLEAQATLEHLLSTEPENPYALEMLVGSYASTGRLRQAEAMLQRLERLLGADEASSWKVTLLRGKLWMARGEEVPEWEQTLRSRYEQQPDDTETLRELVLLLERLERGAEAEQLLKSFVEERQDSADAWVMLGQYHLSKGMGNDQKGFSPFVRALLLEPRSLPALSGLIDLHSRGGNAAYASILCDRYLEIQPEAPEILDRKAAILMRHDKDPENALEVINEAIALDDKRRYRDLRASIHLTMKNYKEALADLLWLGQIRGVDSLNLSLSFAECYAGLGDLEPARQYHEQARRELADEASADLERYKRVGKLIEELDVEG